MLVSVVIPVFNGEATLARAIDSALTQKFDGDFEVIVVNDGSTDKTAEVLVQYGNRIRTVSQENRGLAAARNVGIAQSSGEYIALLDADDKWHPQRLSRTLEPLLTDDACVLSFCNGKFVDPNGRTVISGIVPPHHAFAPTLDEMLSQGWEILPSAVMLRRGPLSLAGGFCEKFGRRGYGGEDTFAFLLLREQGRFAYVPEALFDYTISTFDHYFDKRLAVIHANGEGGSSSNRLRGLIEGYDVFVRLITERYGYRARFLARGAIATQAGSMVALGLAVMNRGDYQLARRCYLMSLRFAPCDPRTYARLAWTFVPRKIGNLLLPLMTPRARRALSGPPFHILQRTDE